MEAEQKAKRAQIDWDGVELHYRAGIRSLMDIAKEYGVSDAGILKRAKRDGWEKNARSKLDKVALGNADEMASAGFLYVIYIDSGLERIYKVGMAKRFDARFDQHQCASPFDICVAICYFTGNMRAEERHLHSMFKSKRVRGEWFRLGEDDLKLVAERSLLV